MDQEIKNAIVAYVGRAALQLHQDEIVRLKKEAERVPELERKRTEYADQLKELTDERNRLNSYISNWQAQCREKEGIIESVRAKVSELTEANTFLKKICWGIALTAPVLGFVAARFLTHN